ncbi:hypothetical protein ACA910_022494 [Epithemia clementina (nom. ined.)]
MGAHEVGRRRIQERSAHRPNTWSDGLPSFAAPMVPDPDALCKGTNWTMMGSMLLGPDSMGVCEVGHGVEGVEVKDYNKGKVTFLDEEDSDSGMKEDEVVLMWGCFQSQVELDLKVLRLGKHSPRR